MLRPTLALSLLLATATPAMALNEATLRGSPSSMVRQNKVAKEQDYTFLRTPGQVGRFVAEGYLERVESNEDLEVNAGVSFPYARPEVHTFVRRLAAQYREGCGERLVITSLMRPLSEQPGNAHPLSVHPAGMALDLRISSSATCRSWIEGTLLSLERKGLLDVTRERRPPHYHVAVFPGKYAEHVAKLTAEEEERRAAAAAAAAAAAVVPSVPAMASGLVAAETAPATAGMVPSGAPEKPYGPAAVLVLLAVTLVAGIRRRRAGASRLD